MVDECSDHSDEELFVGAITKENGDVKDRTIESKVNGTSTILKLDTVAQCNVLPDSLFAKLSKAKITKSKTKLLSYSGHSIKVLRKKHAACSRSWLTNVFGNELDQTYLHCQHRHKRHKSPRTYKCLQDYGRIS